MPDAYSVEQSYVLPVAVQLLAICPHAHYLAHEMEGYAMLPDGRRNWLLRIANWNFNWQADYRLAEPKLLPKGTRLVMHYTYDNSSNNLRNPSQPPVRVRYGSQTTDEMAELANFCSPWERFGVPASAGCALACSSALKIFPVGTDCGHFTA